MQKLFPILILVCAAAASRGSSQNAPAPSSASAAAPAAEDPQARKARELVHQAIEALGGDAWLNMRDREQQGRGYTLHHGRSNGNGALFWSFYQFPDKERVELTKERDIAELYIGQKGYEITYKGVHPLEEKDMVDYLRRRRYSLDTVLRTWVTDPGVIFLWQGTANAAQHPAVAVTLINSMNESVTLYFDEQTHLPVKKSFEWRDPVDRQKNLEEEVYENYRAVSGIMTPFNITRFFNGDIAGERFMFGVTINQNLDQAMFDPNSGYNPNKVPAKK